MYMKQTAVPVAGTAVLPDLQVDFGKAKKLGKFLGLLIIALIASYAGFRFWQQISSLETTDDAYVTGHVNMVSPRISGVVKSVLVDDNEYVKQGQALVLLDPADYQVSLNDAIASLQKAIKESKASSVSIDYSSSKAGALKNDAQGAIAAASSSIERAKAALENAQSGVPMAESTLSQRDAELKLANLNFERMKSLRVQGAISQQDLDTTAKDRDVAESAKKSAQQAVLQAEAQVDIAEQGVNDAQAQLMRSRASLEQAQAESVQTVVDQHQFEVSKASIASAQAKLENAKLQLSYTKITAPVSGRVGRKTVEIGQQVQAGQPLLAVVPDQFWVVANFKETQLERMKPGQEVKVKIDAMPNSRFKGKLDSFSPGSGSQFALLPPDNATGNFTKIVQRVPVKILLDRSSFSPEQEAKIVPGMSAEVEVKVLK